MPPRPDFRLPRSRPGWTWAALLASAALHLLLFLGPIESRPPEAMPPERTVLIAVPPADRPAVVEMVYRRPRRGPVSPEAGRPASATPAPERVGAPPVQREARRAGPPAGVTPGGPVADTAGPAGGEAGGPAQVGPQYANGIVWVRPLPISPEQVRQHLERSHVALVDSAATALVQAFLDSISADPNLQGVKLPDWTTELGGATYGLDSRWIYIAGLKIPTALLALLPWPQGNFDKQKAAQHLMDLREDIYRAARRAETAEEFKQAVRELRDRKEREREFRKAQREPPPPRDSTP
ncbi:MAG: hypothetical protein AB7I33_13365 [Gemmatimonadales bacterium]